MSYQAQIPDTQMRADPTAILGAGGCHAITFEQRGLNDRHIMCVLWTEDDETWSRKTDYSSAWHAELLDVFEKANRVLKSSKPDPSGYGYTGKPGKLYGKT